MLFSVRDSCECDGFLLENEAISDGHPFAPKFGANVHSIRPFFASNDIMSVLPFFSFFKDNS